LGGDYASAIGINDSGQIVGDAYLTGDFVYHAAIWTNSDHAPLDLGSLGGWSVAASIDRVGNIAGYSSTPTNWTFALYWTNATSPPLQLGTLGGVHNQAHSVNDSGQIVGASTPGGSQYTHAVIWSNVTSAPVDLGTVGLDQSFAQAINNSGQIAGWASGSGQTIPLYWANSSSAPVGLAFLGNNSEALGINASGRIVGYSSVGLNGPSHAVLWNNGGSAAIDLNTLILVSSGWELTSANAINDSGEIVGSGLVGGQPHAFALIPSAVALRITSVARVGAVLQLSFTTQAGHMYNVLGTSDLVTGVWTPVETGIAGNGATIQVTIPNQFGQPRQFYRIQQSQ
jgi:probable HAF family extracellular repeat protein